VIHAHSGQYQAVAKLTRRRYDAGELTDEEYNEFMGKIINDFAEKVGRNLIVYDPKASRTWADVCSVIERENNIQPLDLVVIDYLTLLGDPTARDAMAAKILVIQEAKQIALNTGERGFAVVTPVQGNRKGYDDAQANDGVWDTTGIAQYSELDKSLDNCLYVFTNDEISASVRSRWVVASIGAGPTSRRRSWRSTLAQVWWHQSCMNASQMRRISRQSHHLRVATMCSSTGWSPSETARCPSYSGCAGMALPARQFLQRVASADG
jgi:hypothetical protein